MSAAPVEIRLATLADAPVVAEFNVCLAEETEHKRLDPATVEAGVRALLGDPRRGRYFVACRGMRIVGQLMHTFEWSDWRNGDIWWLQSVYVHPDHRQTGVFRALLDHLTRAARATPGVVGLRLYMEQGNMRAQAAYERLGLHPAGYTVLEQMFVDLPQA